MYIFIVHVATATDKRPANKILLLWRTNFSPWRIKKMYNVYIFFNLTAIKKNPENREFIWPLEVCNLLSTWHHQFTRNSTNQACWYYIVYIAPPGRSEIRNIPWFRLQSFLLSPRSTESVAATAGKLLFSKAFLVYSPNPIYNVRHKPRYNGYLDRREARKERAKGITKSWKTLRRLEERKRERKRVLTFSLPLVF